MAESIILSALSLARSHAIVLVCLARTKVAQRVRRSLGLTRLTERRLPLGSLLRRRHLLLLFRLVCLWVSWIDVVGSVAFVGFRLAVLFHLLFALLMFFFALLLLFDFLFLPLGLVVLVALVSLRRLLIVLQAHLLALRSLRLTE